ncbi:MAG: universal stress protein, partial [Candidatus Promineifilaceae bacterium]
MFKYERILVPLDGSDLAERAIAPAVTLANAMTAEINLLSVVTPLPLKIDPFRQALRKEIEATKQYLESARSRFLLASIGGKDAAIVGTEIAQSIINYGDRNKVDLIVMSSQGRSGLGRWVYGSVAVDVLRMASFDTAIIRAQVDIEPFACKRILVPLDGLPLAEQALGPAIEIARSLSAELILLSALTLPIDRGETVCSPNVYELMVAAKEAKAKSYLQQVRGRVSDDQLQIKIVTSFSHLPAAIIEHTKRLNVDLIIMSCRGQSSIRRRSYGSVIEKVLCGAPCATLVIREQEPIHEDDLVRMQGV